MKKTEHIEFVIRKPEEIHSVLTRKIRISSPQKGLIIPITLQSDFFLCLYEAIQNSFQHAASKHVKVKIQQSSQWIEAKIYDDAVIEKIPQKKISKWSERGRGLQIIRRLMGRVLYLREGKKNCLVFRKKILAATRQFKLHDLLDEVSRKLTEAPNLEKIYEIILDKLIELFNVSRASIMIYDPQDAVLKVVAARGIPNRILKKIKVKKGEGISGNVFLKSKPLLIKNVSKELKSKGKKSKYYTHSFLSVPMISSPYKIGEETLGVINITDRLDGSEFHLKDLRLLSILANQTAAYIKIGSLIEELQKTQSLKRDLEIIQDIQHKLCPKKLPLNEKMDVYGDLWISEKGGGDYFDVMDFGDELLLVVADVSGHSVASAFTMANFRSRLRTIYQESKSPGKLLEKLNHLLFEDLQGMEHFICVNMLRLIPESEKLIYAGAGCPPLWIVNSKTATPYLSQSYPLGVKDHVRFEEQVIPLSNQDVLFMHTDGLNELPLSPSTRLGLKGVEEILMSNFVLDPECFVKELEKKLKRKISFASSPDDITFLAARIR